LFIYFFIYNSFFVIKSATERNLYDNETNKHLDGNNIL